MLRSHTDEQQQTFIRTPWLDHLCLRVTSRSIVDDTYDLVQEYGYTISADPTDHPEYCDPYYAFSFRDADALPLEIAYF